MTFIISRIFSLLLHQMPQFRVVAISISKGEDFRDFLVGFGLSGYFGVVYNYLCVEYLLVYALIKVVRDCPNEHPLGKISNLAGRDKTIQLSGYRSRSIIAVDEFTIGGKEEGKQGRSYEVYILGFQSLI